MKNDMPVMLRGTGFRSANTVYLDRMGKGNFPFLSSAVSVYQ